MGQPEVRNREEAEMKIIRYWDKDGRRGVVVKNRERIIATLSEKFNLTPSIASDILDMFLVKLEGGSDELPIRALESFFKRHRREEVFLLHLVEYADEKPQEECKVRDVLIERGLADKICRKCGYFAKLGEVLAFDLQTVSCGAFEDELCEAQKETLEHLLSIESPLSIPLIVYARALYRFSRTLNKAYRRLEEEEG
jgi:hypothetical protein